MLAEIYSGRCKGKEREREERREGITGVERRENCRTGLQFCHCPVVHASSIHMATSMPAELHGLVIQALLCLNRLNSGSFEHDGNAQASSLDGKSDGAPCAWPDLPPLPPWGLLLLRPLGIVNSAQGMAVHRGILSLCHREHRRRLWVTLCSLLRTQRLQREEGKAEDVKGGNLFANALSFLLSFSKAFTLSLIKTKCYYRGRDGLLGEENNKTYQLLIALQALIRADTPTFTWQNPFY